LKVQEFEDFKNGLKQLIEANGIYSVTDYEKLIKIIQHVFPEARKSELIKIFNDIISEFKNESFQWTCLLITLNLQANLNNEFKITQIIY
jgi:hypothetical protein